MDFGRVPEAMLSDIDFKLPAEPVFNKQVLKGRPVAHPLTYLGCAKWGRKEWIGKIYPQGTKEANFLDEYVKHFNSIELNATHYQIYGPATIAKWDAKAAGMDFKFCPKVPQSISHFSTLINAGDKTTAFLEGVLAFGEHLGPIFLQLSDKFGPAKRDNLYQYLASLPKDLQFFVELRHPQWFEDEAVRMELFNKLRELNVGAIITDTAGRRDIAHMHLTVPKIFIRFVGNSLHPTDYTRIDDWANRIKYWLDKGLEEVYFFMHMHDEATSPELALYMTEKFEAVCGITVKKPVFVTRDAAVKAPAKTAKTAAKTQSSKAVKSETAKAPAKAAKAPAKPQSSKAAKSETVKAPAKVKSSKAAKK
ncbi:DUF72 domain-containing protein [Chitinophaga sp. Ak27]|uniref:DUF72 domain-containing protein n=1 Tax=Chitinophaga sp. Ak27 TaxID=2726116 RepID=UPI001B7D06FA|nr:DUF72 domain-containing protein [Chitinophaga sp. Ak27]